MNQSLTARLAAWRRAFSITGLILALLLPTLAQAEPQISFRSVPRYGSFKDLKGMVRDNINLGTLAIASVAKAVATRAF
ncbi:MAG: hypothetical protein HOP18_10240 [Deltaproteobacteria bacterium]|nr:hypothetical protein [Deltaproteobacteria bacterium]